MKSHKPVSMYVKACLFHFAVTAVYKLIIVCHRSTQYFSKFTCVSYVLCTIDLITLLSLVIIQIIALMFIQRCYTQAVEAVDETHEILARCDRDDSYKLHITAARKFQPVIFMKTIKPILLLSGLSLVVDGYWDRLLNAIWTSESNACPHGLFRVMKNLFTSICLLAFCSMFTKTVVSNCYEILRSLKSGRIVGKVDKIRKIMNACKCIERSQLKLITYSFLLAIVLELLRTLKFIYFSPKWDQCQKTLWLNIVLHMMFCALNLIVIAYHAINMNKGNKLIHTATKTKQKVMYY